MKKALYFLFITSALLFFGCASTPSDSHFSVTEKSETIEGKTAYSYTLNSAPKKYAQFIDTDIFFKLSGDSGISNYYPQSCKSQVEEFLNTKQFTIEKVIWNNGKIILLISYPGKE